ncbi:MAG: hypothetical protein ACREFQ_05180 [Stellaceae bacterium]
MTITRDEARIFINCLQETMRQIPRREYQTRMGAETSQIEVTIGLLAHALSQTKGEWVRVPRGH